MLIENENQEANDVNWTKSSLLPVDSALLIIASVLEAQYRDVVVELPVTEVKPDEQLQNHGNQQRCGIPSSKRQQLEK